MPISSRRRWAGTFPTLRIGKRLLVPKDKLIEWIEQNTGGGHVGG